MKSASKNDLIANTNDNSRLEVTKILRIFLIKFSESRPWCLATMCEKHSHEQKKTVQSKFRMKNNKEIPIDFSSIFNMGCSSSSPQGNNLKGNKIETNIYDLSYVLSKYKFQLLSILASSHMWLLFI
jgi:hypothetical protein